MDDIYADLSDDELINAAVGKVAPKGPGYDEDALMKIAQEDLINSVDTKTGAPFKIRAFVNAAQREPDRLTTLQQYYPEAMPVEIFDPENGANKFGAGNFIFKNPDTGQLTLFDEDGGGRLFGLTLADITADIGPEIAETIGAIGGGIYGGTKGLVVGGTVGSLAGPAGTVVGGFAGGASGMAIGEGVGSASARQAYVKLLDYFGETEDTRDIFQQGGDMAITGTINAVSNPAVSQIWRGTKWLGNKVTFTRGAMPEGSKEALDVLADGNVLARSPEETMKVMKRVGVTEPTVAQVTSSSVANLVEMGLQILPTSTRIMRASIDKTTQELEAAKNKLVEGYGGAGTFEETADSVVTSAERARATYKTKAGAMYDEVSDALDDSFTSPATNTAEFVQKYILEAETATGSDFVDPALNQARKVLLDAENGTLTFKRLKDFRSNIMKDLRSAESLGSLNASEQTINDLVPYLTKDLFDLVKTSSQTLGDDTALNLYKKANEFVAKNNQRGSSQVFIKEIVKKGEKESTAALRYALSGAKDSGVRIRKLKEQFTPEEFDVLVGYQLGRMGLPNAAVAGSTAIDAAETGAEFISGQGFQPAQFLKNFNNLSKEARVELFTGGKYDELLPALNDFTFVLDKVNNAALEQMNPSKTGKAISSLGIASMFMEGVPGLGAMGFDFGFSSLIAPYAGAKLMTNPRYVRWLTEAVEIAAFNPNSFGNHVRRLATIGIAEPTIRPYIEATLQGMSQQTIEPIPQHQSQSSPVLEPIGNAGAFREVSTSEVADKVLPERKQLAQSIDNFQMPNVSGNAFGATDPAMAASPTLLPDERDREIAMRQQGIASLT